MTGVDILHVPFKGGAQAIAGLLGEQVDIVVDGTAMAKVKAGKLKALAVTGPRLPALPDVPGIGETIPGFSFTNWWGLLAPAGDARRRRQAPERGAQRRSPRCPTCATSCATWGSPHKATRRSSSRDRLRTEAERGRAHRQGRRDQARVARSERGPSRPPARPPARGTRAR